MSYIVKLYVEGREYTLQQYSSVIEQPCREDLLPIGKPFFRGIKIVVHMDRDPFFFDWALATDAPKKVEVHFIDVIPGKPIRKMRLHDCHCVSFECEFDANSTYHTRDFIHITAGAVEYLDIGFGFANHWGDLPVERTNVIVTEDDEEEEPRFKSIKYYDEKDKQIDETRFTDVSKIKVGVSNISDGESIEITMNRENGQHISANEKEVTFSGIVSDGYAVLEKLELKRDWEINQDNSNTNNDV